MTAADPPPVACSLSGGDYADRVRQWRGVLAGSTPRRDPDGGVRVDLDLGRLPALGALVADEIRCCPFLVFTLTVTHAGVRLDVDAPEEARPVLDDLFPTSR